MLVHDIFGTLPSKNGVHIGIYTYASTIWFYLCHSLLNNNHIFVRQSTIITVNAFYVLIVQTTTKKKIAIQLTADKKKIKSVRSLENRDSLESFPIFFHNNKGKNCILLMNANNKKSAPRSAFYQSKAINAVNLIQSTTPNWLSQLE